MTPIRLYRCGIASVAAVLTGLLVGCTFEPGTPELQFELSSNVLAENGELAADGLAQDQLLGALEMLFGTPSNPGYMLVEEFTDEGFDPNYGLDELSEAQLADVVADNELRFAAAIQAIADGRFDDVVLHREAIDLRDWWGEDLDRWEELRDAVDSGEEQPSVLEAFVAEVQEEWPDLLRNWYPTLRESAELYRQQCLHCHGVEGGGDGPTAAFLDPRPRDYRPGTFKFTALNNKAKPRREDLFRVLTEGIYTTAMPSFRRFSDAQLHGLADYVRLLSIRGRVEILLSLDYDPDEGGLPFDAIDEDYRIVWEEWRASADDLIAYAGDVPPATPERIAHGRELFLDERTANCASCHGLDGRGGGPSSTEQDPEFPGDPDKRVPIKDEWGNDISPRDLTRGIFRFGRRPIDLYRRMYAGINGTPMPSHSSMTDPDGNRLLSDEDLWDIVHFVRSLSSHAPQALPPDGAAGG